MARMGQISTSAVASFAPSSSSQTLLAQIRSEYDRSEWWVNMVDQCMHARPPHGPFVHLSNRGKSTVGGRTSFGRNAGSDAKEPNATRRPDDIIEWASD